MYIVHFVFGQYVMSNRNKICNIWRRGVYKSFGMRITLQWRHNGNDGVSNHQPCDCLLNRLFRRRSKKTSKLRVTGLCGGDFTGDRWIPCTKGPVTRKIFPFDDVIIWWQEIKTFFSDSVWMHINGNLVYIRCCKSNDNLNHIKKRHLSLLTAITL